MCGEFTGDRWIPHAKGQQCGKCFHLMTSSCVLTLAITLHAGRCIDGVSKQTISRHLLTHHARRTRTWSRRKDTRWDPLTSSNVSSSMKIFLISIKISLKFVLLAEVTSATRFCCPMITSSHGNSSRVTDPLIRKSQVSGEFPSQRANIAEFYIVFDISLNKQLNKQLPVIWNAIMLICCHCNTMFHCSYIIIHVEVTLSHVVGTCDRVNRWFRCRSKNSSKLRVTGLCEGNPPVDSHHKGPVTRKMLPIDDVIMGWEWNLPATKHAKRESFA